MMQKDIVKKYYPNCDYKKYTDCVRNYEKNYIINNYDFIDSKFIKETEIPTYAPINFNYTSLFTSRWNLFKETLSVLRKNGYNARYSCNLLNNIIYDYYNIEDDIIESHNGLIDDKRLILTHIRISKNKIKDDTDIIFTFNKKTSIKISKMLNFLNDYLKPRNLDIRVSHIHLREKIIIYKLVTIYSLKSNDEIIKTLNQISKFSKYF